MSLKRAVAGKKSGQSLRSLSLKARASGLFSKIFFFGSFFSTKLDPSDIDVALQFNENNKPADSDLWIFDPENVRQQYLTDVVFIKPIAEIYKDALPENLKCLTAELTLCRALNPKQLKELAMKLTKSAGSRVLPQDLPSKGVLVVSVK